MHVCQTAILLNFCSFKNTFLNIEIQVICCFQTPWKESDMQLFMRLEGCLYRKYYFMFACYRTLGFSNICTWIKSFPLA